MPRISKKIAEIRHLPHKVIQTVLTPKTWTYAQSMRWLEDHGLKTHYMHQTPNFTRWMQNPPVIGAKYYSKVLGNGVILVMEMY